MLYLPAICLSLSSYTSLYAHMGFVLSAIVLLSSYNSLYEHIGIVYVQCNKVITTPLFNKLIQEFDTIVILTMMITKQ